MKALCVLLMASTLAFAQQQPPAVKAFESQAKDYIKVRNKIKEAAPKLSKDSTPEQIEAYRAHSNSRYAPHAKARNVAISSGRRSPITYVLH